MKECLNCNNLFEKKRESAKYCSDKCRVQWNRKNPKKEKGLTELQQMKVMYSTLIEKIETLSILKTEYITPKTDKENETFFNMGNKDSFITINEVKKIAIKRSPANWVELRRECQDADEYSKWLEDLENDIHLTTLEKKQIKATI